MNGIRGTTSTSPPHQVSGQQQQRNFNFQFVGPEDYHPGYPSQQSQAQQQYPVQQLGIQSQSYDLAKQGFGAPRMPSPGIGQQPPTSMYPQQPQQQQQGMRTAGAPFYQPSQQNVRPTRFQTPPNQGMYTTVPPHIMYMNQPSQFIAAQGVTSNPIMIQPRMPTPPYNTGMASTQPGIFPMPQQPITAYQQGYGNAPIFYNNSQTQRSSSASGQTDRQQAGKQRKHMIKIVDPNTGKDVSEEIFQHKTPQDASQDSGSRSTPVGGSDAQMAKSPPNEIAAEFAALVAARLDTPQGQNMQQPPPQEPPQQQAQMTPQQQMGGATPVHPNQSSEMQRMPNHVQPGPGVLMAPGPHPGPPHGGLPPQTMSGHPPKVHPDQENKTVPTVQQPPAAEPMHSAEGGSVERPQSGSSGVTNSNSHSQSLSNGSSSSSNTQKQNVPNVNNQQSRSAEAVNNVKPSGKQKSEKSDEKSVPTKQPSPVVSIKQADNSSVQHGRGEPVTVSVEQSEVDSRTSDSLEGKESESGVSSKTGKSASVSRETTPEVLIMPPTPVEKEAKVELEAPSVKEPEPSIEVTAVPKKAKKKMKELNKKGEKMGGSEYDAYTDSTESETSKPSKPAVSEKEAVEPVVNQQVAPAPERETTPPKRESTPSDETIQKVEIKIQEEPASELEEGEIVDDEVEEEIMLKYKYSEEQWSPLNPEGKKHYDREFLLQFQFETAATSKPAGLPDIPDIILDKPIGYGRQFNREMSGGGSGSQGGHFVDFMPNYVWNNQGQGGGGGGRTSRGLPRQPSNQKNRGPGGPPQKQINLSISKDIELHKAKEAWKPARSEGKKDQSEDDALTEELYKKTRSILNKLTPQKFQTLVSQMQALPIDTEPKLKGVIDLVFEKAISEPNFSVAYANMCRCLSMFKVPSDSKPGEMVNFRAVLLTRCQREFEKDKSSEALFIAKRKEIENADEALQKELKDELEYEELKAKRRSLGNIRFIGELFKLKMLTENIMHDCVFKLLRTKDPENLECLCRLLTTIGKELDTDKAKPRMDQYFQQMGKIVNDKKTSSRVRFMLQDVIDLRANKWVPRRVDNNPKTIDQIHKEVQQEAQEKALLAQQAQYQQKSSRGSGGGGGRHGPPGQRGGGSDGWNTVSSRTPLKVDRSIDPSKMKFSKQNVDESIQLGPGGGASRFAGWGRGSTGGSMGRASQEKEKPNAPANRFSALSKPEEDSSRRYTGVSPARGDSRGRGFGRPPSLSARASQEQEREKAVAAVKAMSSRNSVDGGGHRERSRGRDLDDKPSAPPVSTVKELTKDEMEKKTNAILDEFLHIQDMQEALLCVKELHTKNHQHFIYHAINHVLERSNVARKQTGHLLHDLVKEKIVAVESYVQGIKEVLEFAEDLEIDIPKIWKYYGELISPMIQDGSVPFSFLKEACKPLLANNKAGNLLAEILHDASQREGHKKVAGLWTSSGLQWSDFVPKNQVDQFLADKKLEFTKGGDSAPTTPTTGLPLGQIADRLHDLIVVQHADNEQVFDWIETNVDEPTTKSPKFIRALMTAVCNSAIKGDKGKEKVEQKEIGSRNDLLQKYLDHQAVSELQALYALQALVTRLEHPPGVLRQMFDTLYDEDIISEDAFIHWEKSEEEPEGKGAALKQVVQFFTWLREAEDDS